MNADNNEKVEQIEDLSDLEEAERIEINIPGPSDLSHELKQYKLDISRHRAPHTADRQSAMTLLSS